MEGEVCALLKDESELRDPKGSKKKLKKIQIQKEQDCRDALRCSSLWLDVCFEHGDHRSALGTQLSFLGTKGVRQEFGEAFWCCCWEGEKQGLPCVSSCSCPG